jgi:hypothetical protein
MLNFIENQRTKLIVTASVTGLLVIGAAITVVRGCSGGTADDPTKALVVSHYTCVSCANRWEAKHSPDPRCPKCRNPGFQTYWAKCPACNKYFKAVETRLTASGTEMRTPSGEWSKETILTAVCPNPDCMKSVSLMTAQTVEGWDPPQ